MLGNSRASAAEVAAAASQIIFSIVPLAQQRQDVEKQIQEVQVQIYGRDDVVIISVCVDQLRCIVQDKEAEQDGAEQRVQPSGVPAEDRVNDAP